MAITKAKKVYELSKDNRKILVTLYEGNQVSSCVQEETKRYCESCRCDDETCQEWVESLKAKGYQATEIELGELALEESLPKFLEGRETAAGGDTGSRAAGGDTGSRAEPAPAPTSSAEGKVAVEVEPKAVVEEKTID